MHRLIGILPEFAKQVEHGLRRTDAELADQIPEVGLVQWTYEASEDAGFIYLEPSPPLNMVERKVIFYSHSVEIEDLPGWVLVDVDNRGCVTGIELLNRADIFDELAKKLPRSI